MVKAAGNEECPYGESDQDLTGRLADVSETYTAVYARDGEEWVAEIAEMGLTTRGSNVGEEEIILENWFYHRRRLSRSFL